MACNISRGHRHGPSIAGGRAVAGEDLNVLLLDFGDLLLKHHDLVFQQLDIAFTDGCVEIRLFTMIYYGGTCVAI